jgi:hypothetical protein
MQCSWFRGLAGGPARQVHELMEVSMHRRIRLFVVLLALLVAAVPAVMAGVTGTLRGQAKDSEGVALAGVTVSVESPTQLGGVSSTTTDSAGRYEFVALSPGAFKVTFALDGYGTLEQEAVRVRLDGSTVLDATLAPTSVAESIVVVSEAELVDSERVGLAQTYPQEYLKKAIIGSGGRSYQAVLGQTAGVVGTGNPNVLGSTGAENAYYIDGVNTTDPVTATFGTNFNFDAIDEISFQTAGFEAQYGNATGGLVNLVTKSGGNELSGTFDVRYRTNDFAEEGEFFDPDQTKVKFLVPGVTLGGPIQKDRLWFFTAFQFTDSQREPEGAASTRKFEGNYYLGKLSWQINPSWDLTGKYSSDPTDIAHNNASRDRLPEADAFQEQGGDIFQGDLTAILTSNLLWTARVGVTRQELNVFPQSGHLDVAGHTDVNGVLPASVNYINAQFSNRDRDELATDLDWFAGEHAVKVGVAFADLAFGSRNITPSDFRYEDDGTDPFILWYEPSLGEVENEGSQTTLYAQDNWRWNRFNLSVGVRHDQVAFDNDIGEEVADMGKLQPRVGFTWDLFGDGDTVLRASWGQFMHPSALTLPNFARQNTLPVFAYLSCSAFGFTATSCPARFSGTLTAGGLTVNRWIRDPQGTDPAGFLLSANNIFSSAPSTIQDDLDPMYAETAVIAVEHRLAARTSIELSYVDKETKDLFEDTCDGNLPTPNEDASCDFYTMDNLAGLTRDYQGLILRVESRPIDRLHVLASWTHAKSRGSIEDTQNAGTDFDVFPVHFVNRYGYLSDDRRNRVKVNGYVELPAEFTLGFSAFWSSAFAYSKTESASPYGTEFLEPRGAFRGNSNYQLDIEARKSFTFGRFDTQLIATVLNLLDSERTTGVCGNAPGCGSVDFGGATSHQQPRSYELGVRLEF